MEHDIIPPPVNHSQDESIDLSWLDKYSTITDINLSALQAKERSNYGSCLRRSAINAIIMADRIDPENRSIVTVEITKMAAISSRWSRIKDKLDNQDRSIAEKDHIIEELKSAQVINESRIATLESQIQALTIESERNKAKLTSITDILGDLPDEEDKIAIKEIDKEFSDNQIN